MSESPHPLSSEELKEIRERAETATFFNVLPNSDKVARSLSDIPKLLAEVERLNSDLKKYGEHMPACASREFDIDHEGSGQVILYPCDCGLWKAIGIGSGDNK